MRHHRSPRYAPEGLERRLSPSGLAAQVDSYERPPIRDPGHPTPGDPEPSGPAIPQPPGGTGDPPIGGPSVPSGPGEPSLIPQYL